MRRSTTTCRLLALAVFWLGLVGAPRADSEDFQVIVHPSNPATAVDRGFLREAFLKKTTTWGNRDAIRPIDLPGSLPARERFTQTVLRKSRSQLRSYWNQQIFSGKGVPPPEADSVAGAIAYVLANPGAIAYVPADADARGAKVVRVK